MKCYECGGSYIESSSQFSYKDEVVGEVHVHGFKYYRCAKCGDVLFSPEMLDAIEIAVNERKHQLISNLPIQDFITTAETARLLGISRQALNKNRRIKNGFIHYTNFGDSVVYVKKSVIQFRRTGDGRYPLFSAMFKNYSLLPLPWKQMCYVQKFSTFTTHTKFNTAQRVGKVLNYVN